MRVVRQVAHSAALKALIFLSRLVLVYLLARTLAPADFGVYALITTTTTFGVFLLGLNLSIYVYNHVPGRPLDERLRISKTTFIFEVGLSLILVLLFLASGLLTPVLKSFKATGFAPEFVVGLFTLVAMIAAAELQHYLWARTKIEQANYMDLISQGLWVFPLFIMWRLGWKITLISALLFNLAGIVLGIVYAFSRIEWREWLRVRFDPIEVRRAVRFSLPMIVPAMSFYSLKLADRFILTYYRTLEEVGLYSFAYTFLNTLYSFTALVVLGVFLPHVVTAHNSGDLERRDSLLTYAMKSSLGAFAIAATVLLLFSGPIFSLLARQEYLASRHVLPLLCVGYLLVILAYPANQLLLLQKRTVLIMWIDLAGFTVGLALNFLLVPQYSYYGSAVATIAGFGIIALLKHIYSGIWGCIRLGDLFSFQRELSFVTGYVHGRRSKLSEG